MFKLCKLITINPVGEKKKKKIFPMQTNKKCVNLSKNKIKSNWQDKQANSQGAQIPYKS